MRNAQKKLKYIITMQLNHKWRLILGKTAQEENQDDSEEGEGLPKELLEMDAALENLYSNEKSAGLGGSSPKINRWLGDIRKYFPKSVVQIMQKDALERLGLKQMLLEPELLQAMELNVDLVGTLVSLQKAMPAKTRETARTVVRKIVNELIKKLENPLRQAVTRAISRSIRNNKPKLAEINWHKTIQKNMQHYLPEFQTVVPARLVGYGRKGQGLKEVILLLDQSGSMASSVVYASVFGAVLASLPALKTQVVVFDTEVVNLSEQLKDPVDLLFGVQLGGGTDINKALAYVETIISQPSETVIVLISDLYEGGNNSQMLKRVASLKAAGVTLVSLLSLDDNGSPSYDRRNADYFAQLGIAAFACTPDLFPDLMGAALAKKDLQLWLEAQRGQA